MASSSNALLCSSCRNIFSKPKFGESKLQKPFNNQMVYFDQTSHEAVVRGAKNGCPLCNTVRSMATGSFKSNGKQEERKDLDDCIVEWYFLETGTLRFEYIRIKGIEGIEEQVTIFFLKLTPELSCQHPVKVPSNNTSCSMELAKGWVENCVTHHSDVCDIPKKPSLPTRLLDIGAQEAIISISLTFTAELQPTTRYTTLSHRWGSSVFLKLLQSNEGSMLEGINMTALPTVFREAITVTKRLGIRYLWIDSLCIIQDSVVDWSKEASNMCNIYMNAYCNISATSIGTGTVDTQCFWDRDISSISHDLEVDLEWDISENLPAGTYHLKLNETELWPWHVNSEPLATRGWVLQERILSPRVLHFTNSQLFFECGQMVCCEMYPNGILIQPKEQERLEMRATLRNSEARVSSPENRTKEKAELDLDELYRSLLYDYNAKVLSYEQDKLPAFSGLARQMANLRNEMYHAGLWESTLPRSLLWYIRASLNSKPPPIHYRAPSWSWASVNAGVWFNQIRACCAGSTEVARILHVKTVGVLGGDTFGRLESGFLRVSGFLLPVSFKNSPKLPTVGPTDNRGAFVSRLHFQPLSLQFDGKDEIECCFYLDNKEASNLSTIMRSSAFALPILHHQNGKVHLGFSELEGLLLVLQDSIDAKYGEKVYSRIGYFAVSATGCSKLDVSSMYSSEGKEDILII